MENLSIATARRLPAVQLLSFAPAPKSSGPMPLSRLALVPLIVSVVAGTVALNSVKASTVTSPISLRASSSATVHKHDQVTIPVPLSTMSGDLLVAVVAVYGPPVVTAPSGWTVARDDGHMSLYWHVATSKEPTSYTWKFSSAHAAVGAIEDLAGVDTSSPKIGSSAHWDDVDDSSTVVGGGVRPQVLGARVVAFYCALASTSVSPYSSMTKRFSIQLPNAPSNATLIAADFVPPTTDKTGPLDGKAGVKARAGSEIITLRPAQVPDPKPSPSSSSPSPSPSPSVSPSPTPTPSPSPTPTLPPGSPYEPFETGSYWNAALPSNAAVDPSSSKILSFLATDDTYDYIRLPGVDDGSGHPIYWATSSTPEVKLTCTGWCAKATPSAVRIPSGANAANSSDSTLVLYDQDRGYVLGLWKAVRNSDGSWTAQGDDIYFTSSNGIAGKLSESDNSNNAGHRGLNSSVRQIRWDEIQAGQINHKVELFVNTTKCQHVFPMTGDECGTSNTDAPPEGTLIRINPSVNLSSLNLSPAALTIARALQTYGAVIGDQSGGAATIGMEGTAMEGLGNPWPSVLTDDALEALPFTTQFWQVIDLGYGG